ncbi:cytochrome P450 [Mycobacterium syngnathidarum]
MTDLESVDFFTDPSLIADTLPYFEYLRGKCPVVQEPHHGVMVITGREEAGTILADPETFSSCVAAGGPFPPLPFEPDGDDIRDQISHHRAKLPMSKHIATMDPPEHTWVRSLLSRLFTPRRLVEHEEFLTALADRVLDEWMTTPHEQGRCEFRADYAHPFATLMITHLLGFPEMSPEELREATAEPPEMLGTLDLEAVSADPLLFVHKDLMGPIEDRRREPRDDLLSTLATATGPDGSLPPVIDIVRPASFLLVAGSDTTAKLLTFAAQMLGERPEIQSRLREDRSLVPSFIEECLRYTSPVKTIFRLAARSAVVGGVDVPAGTVVMISPDAVNRDPQCFDRPNEFRIDRKNARDHVTFSRGPHSCLGASLARAEGQISVNRILDRLGDIAIDEDEHGPPENRRYVYEPNFLMRGLTQLHLTYTPLA